jgi:hypothetical protein
MQDNRQTGFRLTILLAVLAAAALPVYAQDDEEYTGIGITAQISSSADVFKITDYRYAYPEIRGPLAQNHTDLIFPMIEPDWWTETITQDSGCFLNLGYNGKNFGGNFRVRDKPDVKVWARFGLIRVSLGNDLRSTYADQLGADSDLRIYTGTTADADAFSWTANVNPDNITDGTGLLVEGLLDRLTLAVAAGYYKPDQKEFRVPNSNIYRDKKTADFRYGARAGWNMGDIGAVNVSYLIKSRQYKDKYDLNVDEIVPVFADAQVFDHLFGLYASLHPLPALRVTAGYNGVVTAYLDEIYSSSMDAMIETGYPLVFRNGFNLNAAYALTDDINLKTDNCLTFWRDKNYKMLESKNTNGRWIDFNLEPKITADRYAEIDHFVLWNGLGMDYDLTNRLTLGAYARNLISVYSVKGMTSGGAAADYRLTRDEAEGKISVTLRLSSRATVGVSLKVNGMIHIRSRDLNAESGQVFIENIDQDPQKPKPTPVETADSVLSMSIPISFSMQL